MSGFAARILGSVPVKVPNQPEPNDFCACNYRCEYVERVFSGTDDYTSDKSSFLFRKTTATDSVTIKLLKGSTVVATITNSTYGFYYNTFTAQPLYVGWIADWKLIYDTFGYGEYKVDAELNILGNTYTIQSRTFRLDVFSEIMAYDTVKLVSYQSGDIVGNDFDLTDLLEGGWPSYYRLPGTFGRMQIEYEKDRYPNSSFQQIQNRDKIVRKYTLSTRFIPDYLYWNLSQNEFLANYHEVYAYDLFSKQEYRGLQVVIDSIREAEYNLRGNAVAQITFRDRSDNMIKRNV